MLVFYDADDDGTPEFSDTQAHDYCQSAAGGPYEMCDIVLPTDGRWFVSVLNFEESANPPDPVALATAVVSADAGNLSVVGPASVPSNTPFDLQVFWDEPAMMVGETWYGAFDLGSDPANPGNVGVIPVDVVRLEDDVVKTASSDMAFYGDTVDFTITLSINDWADGDPYYMLTDTIPAGLTYVPASLQSSDGNAVESGGVITWEGVAPAAVSKYVASTSATDPNCVNLFSGVQGYVDLQTTLGWTTDPGLSGSGIRWSYGGFGTHEFYGQTGQSQNFYDDGYAQFGSANLTFSGVPQDLPDPTDPDNLAAYLWQDLEIVYDAGTNKGITAGSIANSYYR
jgi:uncharacterized repeat protein (TIGR01451 family)